MTGRDSIVIVPAAPERIRNNDAYYPYRQDSDFQYLTGFPEPDAVLAAAASWAGSVFRAPTSSRGCRANRARS